MRRVVLIAFAVVAVLGAAYPGSLVYATPMHAQSVLAPAWSQSGLAEAHFGLRAGLPRTAAARGCLSTLQARDSTRWAICLVGSRTRQPNHTGKLTLTAEAGVLFTKGNNRLLIMDLTSNRVIQTCSKRMCTVTFTNNGAPGKHSYDATVKLGGMYKGRQNPKSSTVTVVWYGTGKLNSFTPDSASEMAGVTVGLHVKFTADKGTVWRNIRVVDVSDNLTMWDCPVSGGQTGQCDGSAPKSSIRKDWVAGATIQFAAEVLDASGSKLLETSPVSITWNPWHPILTASTQKPKLQADTVVLIAGFSGTPTNPAALSDVVMLVFRMGKDGKAVQVKDFQGQVCAGNPCAVDVHYDPNSTGSFFAIVVPVQHGGFADQNGLDAHVGQSNTLTINWPGTHAATLAIPNPGKVGLGTKVTLQAESLDNLTGSGSHIVIKNLDSGEQHECGAEANTCSWDVGHDVTKFAVHSFQAWVATADGTLAGDTSNTVVVTWDTYQILSVTPATQNIPAGHTGHMTATANYPLADGYSVTVADNATAASQTCGSSPCDVSFTEKTPGKHAYTAQVTDRAGQKADISTKNKAEIIWQGSWSGTVSITTTSPASVPINSPVKVTATTDTALPSDFTLEIFDEGGAFPCTTNPCNATQTLTDPGIRTISARVRDASGTIVATAPALKFNWGAWQIQLSIQGSNSNGVHVSIGQTVTLNATANYPVDGTRYVITIGDDAGHVWQCTTSNQCSLPVKSDTQVVHSYVATVFDTGPKAVAAKSEQVIVIWVPACPGGQTECLLLTPTSGTGNAQVIYSFLDDGSTADANDTVHLYWDGQFVADCNADQNGDCSGGFTLQNEPSGKHTLEAKDSAGDSDAKATFTVTGGGGGAWSISMTADKLHPPVGGAVTLTVTTNTATLNTNYVVKLVAPGAHGYVYDTCDTAADTSGAFTCKFHLPTNHPCESGTTCCPDSEQGTGTCIFDAIVIKRGDNTLTPVSNVAEVAIIWGGAVFAQAHDVAQPTGLRMGTVSETARALRKYPSPGRKSRSF